MRRACAWIDSQYVDLGTLPGYSGGIAFDINDAREIVGYCLDEVGNTAPFLWRDGVMYDLNSLTPPGSATVEIPRAINNKGQIAGEAYFGPPQPHGVAFLLTPALPATPGDTNCDGFVNTDDLINVIGGWNPQGPVGGAPADLNRDNRVNTDDLLLVIGDWTGNG